MRYIFFILFLVLGFFTGASALTVSPAKIEIQGDPGQTLSGEIELFNEQNEAKTFFTSFENFESRGASGAPYFTGADDGLATWLGADAEVTLEAGERLRVPYTITIPQDAQPGGYFAAVFFGSQPVEGSGGGEVSIGGKIGVLILLRVSGDISESAGLAGFASPQGKIMSVLPVSFEYGFTNAGGDRIVPRGEVTITNLFGKTTVTLPANEQQGSVLPGSTRTFTVSWGTNEAPAAGFWGTVRRQLADMRAGWYTAHLSLVWGENVQEAHETYRFFIIPWQLKAVVLALLLIIGFGGTIGIQRYNRYIIERATPPPPTRKVPKVQ